MLKRDIGNTGSGKKRCAVMYSGGKDSHLALLGALSDGREVACLINLDGGRSHTRYFNDLRKKQMLKLHSRLSGIPMVFCRVSALFSGAGAGRSEALRGVLRAVAAHHDFEYVYTGASDCDDGGTASWFRAALRGTGLRAVTPLASCDLAGTIALMRGHGVKAVITGVECHVSPRWLGAEFGDKILDYAGLCRKKGVSVDGNDFQTEVIASPIFSGDIVSSFQIKRSMGGAKYIGLRGLGVRGQAAGSCGCVLRAAGGPKR